MAISQKTRKKLNKIYAYVEAIQKIEAILKPLWNEYINKQNITKKKRIWAKIEKFNLIQNNLNDKYIKRI